MDSFPTDGKYRGIEIPGMVKLHWDSKPGRWWKKGVDSVLDSPEFESEEDRAWRNGKLI